MEFVNAYDKNFSVIIMVIGHVSMLKFIIRSYYDNRKGHLRKLTSTDRIAA